MNPSTLALTLTALRTTLTRLMLAGSDMDHVGRVRVGIRLLEAVMTQQQTCPHCGLEHKVAGLYYQESHWPRIVCSACGREFAAATTEYVPEPSRWRATTRA